MDVIELTRRLVAIDSVNPALVPGGAGEPEIARFVVAWAEENGLAAEVLEATPGRPSVVVRKREARGRTLMLCAHLDTVGVEDMADPHTPRLEGDRLYGRGAYDMKSGLAAALIACREAPGDVIVAAVADEEHASLGVQEVLASHTADAAIVTEPTERELIVAHKGFVWIELEVEGRAAHGSRYEEGVDAIVKAGPVLTAIGDLDTQLAQNSHPLLGRGSVHASLIEGGAELSSYPARCTIGLERRTLPGETAARSRRRSRRSAGARRSARCSSASRSRSTRRPRSCALCQPPLVGRGSPARPTGPTLPSSPPPASRP